MKIVPRKAQKQRDKCDECGNYEAVRIIDTFHGYLEVCDHCYYDLSTARKRGEL